MNLTAARRSPDRCPSSRKRRPRSGGIRKVKPALPVAFQDIKIPRSELPSGIHGDVIVEITIDAQGSVVEERLPARTRAMAWTNV